MLHSPEPWKTATTFDGRRTFIEHAGHETVVVLLNAADAERIVACINAMQGIPACDLPKVRALWEHHKSIPMLPPGFYAITPEAQKQLREICGPAGPMPPLPISADLDDKVTRATNQPLVVGPEGVECLDVDNRDGEIYKRKQVLRVTDGKLSREYIREWEKI